MINYNIHNLFPIPVYMTNIDREFRKEELDVIENEKNNLHQNGNSAVNNLNYISNNNYILNKPEFNKIKSFITNHCKNYLHKIISPSNEVELCITQSWLNYTKENEFHHSHSHPNSIISGVLYIDADEENDNIEFTNPNIPQQIRPEIKEYNIWNSYSWWLPVKTGQLLIFPSSLIHQVKVKKGLNTRISLAFNTFYKGTIGSNHNLTELIL